MDEGQRTNTLGRPLRFHAQRPDGSPIHLSSVPDGLFDDLADETMPTTDALGIHPCKALGKRFGSKRIREQVITTTEAGSFVLAPRHQYPSAFLRPQKEGASSKRNCIIRHRLSLATHHPCRIIANRMIGNLTHVVYYALR